MPSTSKRGRRPHGVLVVITMALVSLGFAPAARAARPADPSPVTDPSPTTETPTTLAPTTTEPAPTTTLPPHGPATTTPRGHGTTSTTTTTLAAVPNEPSAVPAPLVPSAESDPLFHAARQVDADYVAVDDAQKKIKPLRDVHKAAAAVALAAQRRYATALTADQLAAARMERAAGDLKGAAMRAYAGYGDGDNNLMTDAYSANSRTNGTERTYIAVTTRQLKGRIVLRQVQHTFALARLNVAYANHRDADRRARAAAAAHQAATDALKAAKHQLTVDTEALMAQVALTPDLAPGTLNKLPKHTKLPPGTMTVASPAGTIVIPASADRRTMIAVAYAVRQYGKPYVWGATGPDTYDCSGLMLRSFQAAGATGMPRVSQAQQVWATPVDPKDAQPGDLVFFGRPAYHVGMYIGGGLMINAPYSGSHVRIDRIWSSFSGFGRVVWG